MSIKSEPKAKAVRLWILEDQSDFLNMLCFVAERQGYNIQAFDNLTKAWEALDQAQHKPEVLAPHLVISDFHLPEGNSERWMCAVRSSFPQSRIICFSGDLLVDLEKRLSEQRIDSLCKPARLSELLEVLKVSS